MTYLAAAFILVWALVALYVLYMGVRQRQVEHEIQILEEMVAERAER